MALAHLGLVDEQDHGLTLRSRGRADRRRSIPRAPWLLWLLAAQHPTILCRSLGLARDLTEPVTNQVVDVGLLTETATSAKELLGADGLAVVANSGYFKIEDIDACDKPGMMPYVPRPQRGPAVRAGLFRKDEFRYDPASDSVLCPAGYRLEAYTSSVIRGLKKVNYVNKEACRDCPLPRYTTFSG